jgi:hypothetical protein
MQVRSSRLEWRPLRRAHQRHTCFGGSAARPDPLVLEIAEPAGVAPAAPRPPRESSTPLTSEPAESDELAQLDEQLLIHASDSYAQSSEHNRFDHRQAPANTSLLELMNRVALPTLRALSTASLEPLRAAMRKTTEEQDSQLWAAYHVLLGGALKLRSDRTRGSVRATLLIGATRAFDVAYSVYATPKTPPAARDFRLAQSNPQVSSDLARHRPLGRCVGERDGTSLIARVISGPVGENTHLLERAVTCLRLARAGADIKSWTWVSSTNNLACALTLLGNRIPARAGAAMLEEAARVLHEALRAHADGHQREDRGSTLVNLAEALLSMAERETPAVRVKQVERAFMASSAALRSVVPPELAWLVTPERREIE